MMKTELIKKINCKKAKLGIIGLGYVGLPLAREFLNQGFHVIGFDSDFRKVKRLNKAESYIRHISDDFLKSFVLIKKIFRATADFSELSTVDCILICVPTPLGKYREPDLSHVLDSTKTILKYLRRGQTVILESTTYPGTTEEELLPILNQSGLRIGKDFFLGYSPEREDPGNKQFATADIPKVVSGITDECLDVIEALYSKIVRTVRVSSCKVAEATKILENTYRAVNIAMVNELKMLFDRMGINIWEVISASKSKPFGFQPFYPGPGLGGHCIPIDPFYLTYKAKQYGFNTRFIELAGEINTFQPFYVVENAVKILNQFGKTVNGSRILILGVAYKKDIDDVRESPALKIIELLQEGGARVDYWDPLVPVTGPHRNYPRMKMKSIRYSQAGIRRYDLLILVTDHPSFPYRDILKNARLILDTRNAFHFKSDKLFRS